MIERLRTFLKRKNKKDILPEISPTFCVYPWIGFSNSPAGAVPVCCYSTENYSDTAGKTLSIFENKPDQVWNHDSVRNVRSSMFNGLQVKGCERCYESESKGFDSHRLLANREWLKDEKEEILNRVETSSKNNFFVEKTPLFLDLRPSNKCNLKCRMCSPSNSSLLELEVSEMVSEAPYIEAVYEQYKRSANGIVQLSGPSKTSFWKDINEWVPRLKKVYLTGGEPMLLKENWELIDKMITSGTAAHCKITFSTNCTVVPSKLKDVFEHFQETIINLSIDGTGNTQEYIRSPSRWNLIEKNVRQIVQMANEKTSIYITPTLQIYNSQNIVDLFEWADQLSEEFRKPLQMFLLPLSDLPFLSMSTLPKSLRLKIANQVKLYQSQSKDKPYYTGRAEMIKDLLILLETGDNEAFQTHFETFIKFTNMFDKKRNENIKSLLPELFENITESIDSRQFPNLYELWQSYEKTL